MPMGLCLLFFLLALRCGKRALLKLVRSFDVGKDARLDDVRGEPAPGERFVSGRKLYGYGNCKGKYEGVCLNGFIQTNLLGPALVKNPWFAEGILKTAAARKGIVFERNRHEDYTLERKSNERIKSFIRLKQKGPDATRLDNEE